MCFDKINIALFQADITLGQGGKCYVITLEREQHNFLTDALKLQTIIHPQIISTLEQLESIFGL